MKKLTILFVLAIVAIGSCTKPEPESKIYNKGTITEPVDTNNLDTSYYITEIRDIIAKQIGGFNLNMKLVHTDGIQKNVTVSISGIPEQVKIKGSVASGYTPFEAYFVCESQFLPAGDYPVTITTTPNAGTVKIYNVKIKVDSMPYKECETYFFQRAPQAQISVEDLNQESVPILPSMISRASTGDLYIRNLVLFYDSTINASYVTSNENNYQKAVKFVFSCDNGSLIIPPQKIIGYKAFPRDTVEFNISGEGKLDLNEKTYHINYTTDSANYRISGGFNN